MAYTHWVNLFPSHPNNGPPSVELKMNKKLIHHIQCRRSVIGFVVVFKLSEVPVNASPPKMQFIPVTCQSTACWGLHHQPQTAFCEASAAILGYLRGSQSSQLMTHSKGESLRRDRAIDRRVVQTATALFLSLKALQQLYYQPDSKAATKAHQTTGERPAF